MSNTNTKDALEALFYRADVTFAPDLYAILTAAAPPTIAMLKKLPSHYLKVWIVYVIRLEKKGRRAKAYIGSGTDSMISGRARMQQYNRVSSSPIVPTFKRHKTDGSSHLLTPVQETGESLPSGVVPDGEDPLTYQDPTEKAARLRRLAEDRETAADKGIRRHLELVARTRALTTLVPDETLEQRAARSKRKEDG
ncbi:hypothetical protein KVT40_006922 [Elsinoe batatas]|uniref:Uncharacterized protein n=1 Tax=Elsinoe batatas TaxID=2601811 RepID=A0A8K0PD13_9PEZI|nr:hypothetical protein KVT40_006922 [Elsinoe batatas]